MDIITLAAAKSYTDEKFQEFSDSFKNEVSQILALLGDEEDEQDQ